MERHQDVQKSYNENEYTTEEDAANNGMPNGVHGIVMKIGSDVANDQCMMQITIDRHLQKKINESPTV